MDYSGCTLHLHYPWNTTSPVCDVRLTTSLMRPTSSLGGLADVFLHPAVSICYMPSPLHTVADSVLPPLWPFLSFCYVQHCESPSPILSNAAPLAVLITNPRSALDAGWPHVHMLSPTKRQTERAAVPLLLVMMLLLGQAKPNASVSPIYDDKKCLEAMWNVIEAALCIADILTVTDSFIKPQCVILDTRTLLFSALAVSK